MPTSSPQRPVVAIRVFATDAQDRILLLRRANSEYGEGQWCLPGGKLDYGDTPEGTVAKELGEETGLAAKDVEFLFYQNSPPPQPGKMHCVNLYFRCTAIGAVTLNEESSAFVWVTLEEALGYKPVFGAEAAIRRVIEQGKVSASTAPGL
jgi:8-oxo-dGTP diphosphatase